MPERVKVVVVRLAVVSWIMSAGVVRSLAVHAQACAAVAVLPVVITRVHVPVVPEWKEPAVAPPTKVVSLHPPLDVKVVPVEE